MIIRKVFGSVEMQCQAILRSGCAASIVAPRITRTIATITHSTNPEPPLTAYIKTPPSSIPQEPIEPKDPTLSAPVPTRYPQLSRKSPLPPASNLLEQSVALLPLLAAQPPHYITAHIHARPYLLTAGDTVRLPFHMPNATPGSILRLNRASMLGSRDFTFRGDPWLSEKYFTCRAVVVGVEGEPLRILQKTKRRNRRVKTIKSKMRFTVLRIMELKVWPHGKTEDLQQDEGVAGSIVD